ncbi:hypothetical protein HDU97_000366 [Phlyctochytrium planicorne]|nr:hypothetical protein HDU97_000366 [Phlyctochytrium planicorne]
MKRPESNDSEKANGNGTSGPSGNDRVKRLKADVSDAPVKIPAAKTDAEKVILFWFRTDLRLEDNTALHAAAQASVTSGHPLVALFVISPGEWVEHDLSPAKVWFILENLKSLKKDLSERSIPLCVRMAETRHHVPNIVLDVVDQLNASEVYWNKEYEVNEGIRDAKVDRGLHERKRKGYDDQCIVPPGLVRTKENRPYTVFTPMKKTWIVHLVKRPSLYAEASKPNPNLPVSQAILDKIESLSVDIPDELETHPVHPQLLKNIQKRFPIGEAEALKKLEAFATSKSILSYKASRDIPSLDGTSMLSPYLALGVVSARACLRKALAANNNKFDSGNEGAVTWISELCWRDFYRNILVEFPRVCKNKPFLEWTDSVPWVDDEDVFNRWCEGKTGYPLVDAGMRQLKEIGWMHNRLRMVTAMFLVKDLGVDWRKGEKWFMQHLIDGDLASNNGGWQWAASTGTDAQPYFRIFNPTTQSERFDPDGKFIRKYIPELATLTPKTVHDPQASIGAKKVVEMGYVKKIVDHKTASNAIKELFKIAHQAR